MAFRKVVIKPTQFEVEWEDTFEVLPWTGDRTEEIGHFLFSTGTKRFAECSDCRDGSAKSANYYVARALEYMKDKPGRELGYAASSLVVARESGKLIAVCLCCGASVYHIEVHPDYQRRGIATRMLQHALSVCAKRGVSEFHLWRHDGAAPAKLYEKIGFVDTDETE